MAKWRCINARPDTPAVGHDQDEAAIGRQDAPHFAQHTSSPSGAFKAMDSEQPVNGIVGQRPVLLFDQDRVAARRLWPHKSALPGWHETAKPQRFGAERPKIRRREACAEDAQAVDFLPACTNAGRQLAAHGLP